MKVDLASLRGLDAHKAALTDLRGHLSEIDTEAAGRAFDDKQKADFEETLGSIAELQPIIEELEVRSAAVAANAADAKRSSRPEFHAPNINRTPDDIFDLAAYRRGTVEETGAAYLEGAKRVLDAVQFPTVDKAKGQERVSKLIENVYGDGTEVARRVIQTASPRYMRAWAKYVSKGMAGLTAEEQRSLQSGSDADGGVALPFTIDPTFILTTDGAANPVRDLARVVPITTKAWQPVTTEGVVASYGTETSAQSDDAPSDFDGSEVTPLTVKVTVKFTAAYAEDYGLGALTGEVGTLIRDAKDVLEAEMFVQGTGTGEPEGVVWFLDDENAHVVTQGAFDLDALDEVTGDLGERFQSAASIMLHRKIAQKARQLGDAGHPANSIYDGLAGTLYGYPSRISSYMDDAVTSGQEPLLIGAFKTGFVIVDRIGLSTEFIPQMFDGNGDPTGERAIFARWRNTSKVIVPNAFRLLKIS